MLHARFDTAQSPPRSAAARKLSLQRELVYRLYLNLPLPGNGLPESIRDHPGSWAAVRGNTGANAFQPGSAILRCARSSLAEPAVIPVQLPQAQGAPRPKAAQLRRAPRTRCV